MLTGLQVLDLAQGNLSFCSKLLADLGAQVIKIEPPQGEASRWTGPFYENTPHPERSLSFWYHNANKVSLTLDLESEPEQEQFSRLARKADVIIESFPPGYLQNLKLGYDRLSKINPSLILVSITAFGQTGPYRDYKSCDIVASAIGGQMYVCGACNTPPLKPYGEQSFYIASLFAAIGVLLALRHRHSSGRGQHIDVSLQEAIVATLEHVLVHYFHEGITLRRREASHPDDSLYLLPCKDGYILVVDRDWDALIGWLDSEGMAADLKEEAWQREEYRRQHWQHVAEVLSQWTKSYTRAELFSLAQMMRLPWAPVCSLEEMINSPQHSERNFFVPVEHPELEASFLYPASPFRFARDTEGAKIQWRLRRAPLIGEHNPRILGDTANHKPDPRSFPSSLPVREIPLEHGIAAEHQERDALRGIRILDFTWLLAGPYATRILADFGAEVIKVQSAKTATGAESNTTGYFNTWNRNKLSITLNMNHPKARDIALKLVKVSDVVVENFTPRVKLNWGLDYENLKKAKPDIILLSLSAMGQNGPWRNFTALGHTIQAFSGMTYLSSFPRKTPIVFDGLKSNKDTPLGLGFPYADVVSGLYATLAILAALEYRHKTGQGQYIDLSEYECMCSLLGPTILDYTVNHNIAEPQGNTPGYVQAAPYGCYQCNGEDRWCVIAVFTDKEWETLCQVLGEPAWSKEDRFSTLSARRAHAEELDKLLEQWTIKRTPREVTNLLQQAGVPAGMVASADDLVNDPHLRARNFFVQIEHPLLGKTISDSTPIRLSETPASFRRPAPLLGQDNDYVYGVLLGLSQEELRKYVEEGVIA